MLEVFHSVIQAIVEEVSTAIEKRNKSKKKPEKESGPKEVVYNTSKPRSWTRKF